MTTLSQEGAGGNRPSSINTLFNATDNNAYEPTTQYHPSGPSANCQSCSAGCTIWPGGDPRRAYTQCRRTPERDSHAPTFWCLQWSLRVPAVPR